MAVEELPILAAIEESEAVADNLTSALVFALETEIGVGPFDALPVDLGDCNFFTSSDSTADQLLARFQTRICLAMRGILGTSETLLFRMLQDASAGINAGLDAIESLAASVEARIGEVLEGIVGTLTAVLDSTLRSLSRTLDNTVRDIGDFLAGVIDRIERGVEDVLTSVALTTGTLISNISAAFGGLLDAAGAIITRIDSTVRAVGDALTTLAEATAEAITGSIAGALEPLIGAGASVLARLGDLVESVPGALGDAARTLVEGVGTFVGDPLGSLGSIIVTQVEEHFQGLIDSGSLSHGEVIRRLLGVLGAPADVADRMADAADEAAPVTPAITTAVIGFLVAFIMGPFIASALQPLAEQAAQEISEATRQTLIPPTDLLDGFLKGDITPARFQTDMAQAGFSQERTDELLAAFRRAPDVSTMLTAWLRGLSTDDELDAALIANRMRPVDARLLKQVVFFVPPAQDLIRMAVREVFSPDVRERFGQDEDFPDDFAEFARQQGISEEWARRYWAAHWTLPSATQGFEMLHRKVIGPDDLDALLRALDVMPFWRDKLTAIAHSPLTRVDVRRMHALGLLTDRELQLRYEDLGFSPDDAGMMTAFTVAFNAFDDELPEELEGLTRSSILGLFDDGLLERADAVTLLTQAGTGAEAAELFVAQREIERQRRERSALIESIVQLAGGGHVSLPDAQDTLLSAGLTASELARAVGRITGIIDGRDRVPPLGDLKAMFARGVLDEDGFRDALGQSGFSDTWIDRELALVTGGEA